MFFFRVSLFALCHHDHRESRVHLLDALQRLQSAEARHLLVEQHQVEMAFTTEVDGVGAVAHRHHVIALALQEQLLSMQLLDLIIHPQ